MKLLLDTHIFLWYIVGDSRLPSAWASVLRDPSNEVNLSAVSVWETCIKHQLGKLPLPKPPIPYLIEQRIRHQINALPLQESDLASLVNLPPHHRDPFDRALIAQALSNGLTIVTVDPEFKAYGLPTLRLEEASE